MLGFAVAGSTDGLIVGVILAGWLAPALLSWLVGRRDGVSLRAALVEPGTLTFAAIVVVVLVCVLAGTN